MKVKAFHALCVKIIEKYGIYTELGLFLSMLMVLVGVCKSESSKTTKEKLNGEETRDILMKRRQSRYNHKAVWFSVYTTFRLEDEHRDLSQAHVVSSDEGEFETYFHHQ